MDNAFRYVEVLLCEPVPARSLAPVFVLTLRSNLFAGPRPLHGRVLPLYFREWRRRPGMWAGWSNSTFLGCLA